ncbi:MAG: NAD-dependent epimerase/dehydratase family protein [Gammaproteobacteria bacterium]
MRIVITGNMGYVGPTVVAHLRSAFSNIEIAGVDSCFFGHSLTNVDRLPEVSVDVQYFADVRDLRPELFEGADVVVQLAAISNDPMGNAFENVTMDVNSHAAIRIGQLAKQAGVARLVFASSCSVYGYAEDEAKNESSAVNPLTAYARSKLAAEEALSTLASDNFIVSCLRFPTACGMSPRLRLDLVLNDFVASAIALGRIEILSDGTPWRPIIDTKDMARGIEWAIRRDARLSNAFEAINVGRDDANYRISELSEAVARRFPSVEVEIRGAAAPDKRSYRVDFARYRALAPDFLPTVSLDQSIDELRDGLLAMGFADRNFRESLHMRLNVLRGLVSKGILDDKLRWISRGRSA